MKWAAIVLALCATATAQPDKPWAAGVSDAEQAQAFEIYEDGNKEFAEARYQQALAKYREALKHWDHPQIRFNIVVCLINLDQSLEALENLEQAMKYGAEPLGADVFAQAQTYERLLHGQLPKLQIVSKESGADISLDGVKLFTAPGEVTKFVTPGPHQIVATKVGYATRTIPLTLLPGKVVVREVSLIELKSVTLEQRRWPVWVPYAVLGGAVAIGGAGVLYYNYANDLRTEYGDEFAKACPTGCRADLSDQPELAKLKDREESARSTSKIVFVVAAVTATAGVVMLYLNRSHSVRVDAAAGPNGAYASLRGSF